MASWFESRRAVVSYTRIYEDTTLPNLADLDLVVIVAAPWASMMNRSCPQLGPEKQFIRKAIERGVAMLGVCLGAQLIVSASGSRVYRNPVKEIGWFPIEANPHTAAAFRFPSTCTRLSLVWRRL